jgi:hypothetical protein
MPNEDWGMIGEGDHVKDFEFDVRPLEGVLTSVPLVGLMFKNLDSGGETWYPLTAREAENLAHDLVRIARSLSPPPGA